MANFESIEETGDRVPIKLMGYQNFDYLMVLPSVFDEFCGSYSKRQLLKVLVDKNYISVEAGRLTKKIPARMIRKERPRCHWISKNFLDD